MDQERVLLEDRLSNLERQLSVFERMVHMLSGSLDHRFKKYDMVICSQQQQISELNAVFSTFLNDEYRHAEILREKLTGTLHGISATAASIGNTCSSNDRYVPDTSARSLDPDSIFNEILAAESPHSPPQNPSKQDQGPKPDNNAAYHTQYNHSPQISTGQHETTQLVVNKNQVDNNTNNLKNNNSIGGSNNSLKNNNNPNNSRMDKNNGNDNGNNNNNNNNNTNNNNSTNNKNSNNSSDNENSKNSNKSIPHTEVRQLSMLSYGDFGHIADTERPNINDSIGNQGQYYNDHHTDDHHITNSDVSGRHSELQPRANHDNHDMGVDLKEEQYVTNKGRKRKRSVYVGNFQFLKSPHSVMEVWKEYTEGVNGQPSIREMETIYQTGWRRDPAVNKRYSRRKVLCKAIETGLARGYSLEYIVNLLEDYRYINREKGLKQPIGWICQGQNIPESLR